MTEGFDLSSYVGREVPVEAVILYTATASLSRYLQCVGRGLRPKPEPAIIIDHGNSCAAFGLPDEPREWTLADEEKQPRGKKNKVRIMTCKKCYAVHRPAPVCPECGYIHDLGRKVKIVDGELVEVDSESKYTKAYKAEYARLKTLQALRGYKRGWVFYMMQQWKLRQTSRTE